MIRLSVNDIDLSGYITKINFESTPDTDNTGSSGNSGDYFINYDGRKIYSSYDTDDPDGQSESTRTFRTVIKATAEGVPNDTASALSSVLTGESFNASYTSPAFQSGKFLCTSYSAEPDEGSHEDGSSPDWILNFVIETAPTDDQSDDTPPGSDTGSGL